MVLWTTGAWVRGCTIVSYRPRPVHLLPSHTTSLVRGFGGAPSSHTAPAPFTSCPATLPVASGPDSASAEFTASPLDCSVFCTGEAPKILKRIPRASRPLAACKVACILDGVTAKNDLVSWDRLFRFPLRCLRTPVRGGHRRSLVSVVNQQLREEVDPPSTQQGSLIGVRPNPNVKSKHKSDPLSSLATRVASKLEEGDYRGAVRLACSDDTIADMNAETVAALQTKHPLLQWNLPPPSQCRRRM